MLLRALIATAVVVTSVARASDQQKELTAVIDQLCDATGLRRVSPVELQESDRRGRHIEVALTADEHERRYDITVEWSGKIASFMPKKFDFEDVGQGYDTLSQGPAREMCTRITRIVGERLKWKWVSGPLIQRLRQDFVVTYVTMSEKEQAEAMGGPEPVLLHPYVSFLVTPRGTVFGGFHGS